MSLCLLIGGVTEKWGRYIKQKLRKGHHPCVVRGTNCTVSGNVATGLFDSD